LALGALDVVARRARGPHDFLTNRDGRRNAES
jgi:hypothetical protein